MANSLAASLYLLLLSDWVEALGADCAAGRCAYSDIL